MTLQDIFKMPPGKAFKYKGRAAKVVWQDPTEYLILKADPSAKPPTPDIYFRAWAMFFTCEGSKEGITFNSCCPEQKDDMPDFHV